MRLKFRDDRPMFYHKVIEPLLQPFKELAEYTGMKLFLIGAAMVSEFSLGDMFETPSGYAWALFFLVVGDSLSKSIRIWFIEKETDWNIDYFIRKFLYKLASYALVVLGGTIWSNQFADSNHIIYVVYAGLGALEVISIARHQKVFGYLVAFGKQVAQGKIDFQKLKQLADEYELTNLKKDEGKPKA